MEQIFRVTVLLIVSSVLAQTTDTKQTYFIGGWAPISREALTKKYTPLFQDYLTQEVGSLYDPPISFKFVPFFYDENSSPESMIKAGQLDFAYQLGAPAVCLEAEHGYTIIATQVQITMGMEVSCLGTVFVSLDSNTQIRNISDFRGKRIGVGFPWAAPTFSLGVERLQNYGLDIYTDFAQVVFYMSDYLGLAKGILQGDVDVAIVQSGWIETNLPNELRRFRFHGLVPGVYYGEPVQLPTSTRLIPSYALTAAPHIRPTLRFQVYSALRRLNASHPVARASGVVRFTMPASYEIARSIVQKLNLMQTTPTGRHCRSLFQGLDSILACPAGFDLKAPAALRTGCETEGLPCPANKTCYCRPCAIDRYSNVFPWEIVLGLCAALLGVGFCFRCGWLDLLDLEREETEPQAYRFHATTSRCKKLTTSRWCKELADIESRPAQKNSK